MLKYLLNKNRPLKITFTVVLISLQPATKVAIVLRPKYTHKPEDYQQNVSSLGSLLVKLSTPNEEQIASFDPSKPAQSRSSNNDMDTNSCLDN